MKTFVLHPEAYHDLSEIWDYIADDSVDAADRTIEEVFSAIGGLIAYPNQGFKASRTHQQTSEVLPVA